MRMKVTTKTYSRGWSCVVKPEFSFSKKTGNEKEDMIEMEEGRGKEQQID